MNEATVTVTPSFDLNWGGAGYPLYDGNLLAAGSSAVAGAGGGAAAGPAAGGSPSSAASGTEGGNAGATSGTTGSATQGSPTTTTGSPTNGNDPNIAVLRQSHEFISKHGGMEKLAPNLQTFGKIYDAAAEMARSLNITPESFEEAFAEAPIDIYNHLASKMREAVTARRGSDNTPDVNQVLNQRLAPIERALVRQTAREANNLINGEFDTLLNAHDLFKGKTVDKELADDVYDLFTDMVKADDATQNEILQGKTGGLKRHFDAAVAKMVRISNGYGKFSGIRSSAGGQGGNAGRGNNAQGGDNGQRGDNANPFTLDDIIEGNDNATKSMSSLRNFR